MDTSIAQRLTPRVEAAIKTILGDETDAFDASQFDVVDYVNSHFPDDKSLGGLDAQIAAMELEIRDLDNSILGACRARGRAVCELFCARSPLLLAAHPVGLPAVHYAALVDH